MENLICLGYLNLGSQNSCQKNNTINLNYVFKDAMHKGDYVMCMGKGTCIVKKVSLVFFVFLRHQPNI